MSTLEERIIQNVKEVCNKAIENGTQNELTVREVIQTLINDFQHDQEVLQSKSIKKIVKQTAAELLQPLEELDSKSVHGEEIQPEKPEENQSSKPVSKKRKKALVKGRFKSSEMVDSDGNSIHEESEDDDTQNNSSKKTNAKRDTKSKSSHCDQEGFTSSNPDPSKGETKSKSQASTSSKKNTKAKRESLPVDKDEDRIKKLKSLVVACGVRKQWKKEFKDCSNEKQQISHLNKILHDLGMKGRMSMAQAKEIKTRRELEAEVNELADKNNASGSGDEKDNITDDQPDESDNNHEDQKSSSKKPRKNHTVEDSSDSQSNHDRTLKKPKSKRNPFAFLGDQGSEDST